MIKTETKSIDSNSSNIKESNLSFKLINEIDCDEMNNNMLVHCIDKIGEIMKSIGAEYIVLNSTPEGYYLYTKVGNFDVIDEDYLLPDWKSDPEAIRMAKQIRLKL